jgi:hypothetical protein
VLTLNISEAMTLKREIQTTCGIDFKMLDTAEEAIILYIERETQCWVALAVADFEAQKNLVCN